MNRPKAYSFTRHQNDYGYEYETMQKFEKIFHNSYMPYLEDFGSEGIFLQINI